MAKPFFAQHSRMNAHHQAAMCYTNGTSQVSVEQSEVTSDFEMGYFGYLKFYPLPSHLSHILLFLPRKPPGSFISPTNNFSPEHGCFPGWRQILICCLLSAWVSREAARGGLRYGASRTAGAVVTMRSLWSFENQPPLDGVQDRFVLGGVWLNRCISFYLMKPSLATQIASEILQWKSSRNAIVQWIFLEREYLTSNLS